MKLRYLWGNQMKDDKKLAVNTYLDFKREWNLGVKKTLGSLTYM